MKRNIKHPGTPLSEGELKSIKGGDGAARCMPMPASCDPATINDCCVPALKPCAAIKEQICKDIWPLI